LSRLKKCYKFEAITETVPINATFVTVIEMQR
jgi:hypothetical protein